ncbi:restriction endonuclease [Mesorhizobium sp. L103C131B0]|uniref:restriction endonuclease n=1 Tax=Mesorhizobium sp. L103C131B0 TaxID=1287089 RepID=UPI0018CA8AB0|nr:restriction endonuclease [Mesorhizobium sp. L103C131B0]
MQPYDDIALAAKIATLEQTIEAWARQNDLWFDCGFKSYLEHVDGEPNPPSVVSLMYFEGPLFSIFNGYADDEGMAEEFYKLVDGLGFDAEQRDGTSMAFFAQDPEVSAAFDALFHWQWVCSLLKPDCSDVYEEIYAHFAGRPDDLHRLSWREYEILLYRIFQSQGFQAELGPGRNDGGVDIRLLQRDPIGDILTLVQAKKYAPHRNIRLDAVAALHGIAAVENAQKSIVVTTSNYEPVAKRFAARTSGSLQLATSADVVGWCEEATAGIIKDKSCLSPPKTFANCYSVSQERKTGASYEQLWLQYGSQ